MSLSYHSLVLSYLLQNAGENITRTVNNSSRPKSIPNANIHFAKSGKLEKFPVGPIVDPRPGPTLLIAVAAPDIAVMKSSPRAESPAAKAAKQTMYKKPLFFRIEKKNRKNLTKHKTSFAEKVNQ